MGWLASLGTDAATVAGLVLDMPDELQAAAQRRGGTPRNYRRCLKEYLNDQGWDPDRVLAAITEIQTA
jgi:hypothetical protein